MNSFPYKFASGILLAIFLMYFIWFEVTPCVYLYLPGRVCSLENCLALFYYREQMFGGSRDFLILKRTVLLLPGQMV